LGAQANRSNNERPQKLHLSSNNVAPFIYNFIINYSRVRKLEIGLERPQKGYQDNTFMCF
jgi:hypothetical protein